MFTVYILYSSRLHQFYKGFTTNLPIRILRHNAGKVHSTKLGAPWILIWSTSKNNSTDARRLEVKLKNLSQKRLIDFMVKYEQGVAGPDELLLLKQLSG